MRESCITYKLFPKEHTIICRMTGVLTFVEMIEYVQALRADSGFVPGMNSFTDLTQCEDVQGELASLSEMAKMLNDPVQVPHPCKSAILLPNDNEKITGMAKGLVLLTSKSKNEYRWFEHWQLASAYQFIDFNPDSSSEAERFLALREIAHHPIKSVR